MVKITSNSEDGGLEIIAISNKYKARASACSDTFRRSTALYKMQNIMA